MATAPQSAGVLSFEQALDTVVKYCGQIVPPATEEHALFKAPAGQVAIGWVLAEPIRADRDFPPFPRSTRDGYAVRSADVKSAPVKLRVVGQVKAGGSFDRPVAHGEAVEIMTGAPVPDGADAVVMLEYTSRNTENSGGSASVVSIDDQVEIRKPVDGGENVVPAGAEARAGQEVLPRGMRLGPAQIAMAAAAGKARIKVYRRPHVAILATGDELVEVSKTPGPFQIRNSNGYSLAAQVNAAGGKAVPVGLAPDEESQLRHLIELGLHLGDMLLITGGVSAGKFDLVEPTLKRLGAKFFFTGALIQPGRPVVFGEIPPHGLKPDSKRVGKGTTRARALTQAKKNEGSSSKAVVERNIPFFGLPGNPISAMVCFDLFARPVLEALGGAAPTRLPAAKARLRKAIKTRTGLTRFLPAVLEGGVFHPEVEAVPWQGSGDLLASARANCYLVVPPDRDLIAAGEMVSVVMR